MGQGLLSSNFIEHPPPPPAEGRGLGGFQPPTFLKIIELLRKSVLAPHFESVVSATSPPPPLPHFQSSSTVTGIRESAKVWMVVLPIII